MADGCGTRKGHAVTPLDEEWKCGLARRDLDAGAAPAYAPPSRGVPKPRNDGQTESPSDCVDRIRSDRPSERASGTGGGDPSPERGLISGLPIGDGDEFHVAVAKRDDPVRRAPGRMSSTRDGGQPVARFDLGPREGEVGNG